MREYIYRYPGISSERYKELLAFCRQLDEYKQKIKNCYDISAIAISDIPKNNGGVVSSTEKKALEAIKYREYIEMIESSAAEAGRNNNSIAEALINNICYGIRYEYLSCCISRNSFFRARRRFFCALSEKK